MSERQTPEQIQADIEAQRERLATTVDELSARLDVTAHARRPEVLAAAGSLVAMAIVLVWWRRRNN